MHPYKPIDYKQLKAKREKQRLERLAQQTEQRYQVNADYWNMVQGFEELREKFKKDEEERQKHRR